MLIKISSKSNASQCICCFLNLPFLVLEKIFMLVGVEFDEERKMPLKLRRRGDLGGEF